MLDSMKTTIVRAVAGVGAVLALCATPVAHADDQGFLDELYASGVQTGPQTVELGHEICNEIRAGAAPDDVRFHVFDVVNNPIGTASFQAVKTVIAAQHNICPDPEPWRR